MTRAGFVDGSLRNRIRQFYAANPDEELTYSDICVKFDCSFQQARSAVNDLQRSGENLNLEALHVIRVKRAEVSV